ncbi:hypothetical protein NQ318_016839 [Aromia moschata]|uniref:Paramyosin n=1 Tax=Aromia moschata TaxID=1265417 RepID=A0AAV8YVD0_9CUCU|nr:hypothetical protein NQ318_016839 [Aromia moschata]
MSSSVARTSKYSYRSSGAAGGSADVSIEYSADLTALSRLEDKIRLLQDDLEIERELRSRIEREKADLSVQVIQLSERLEEAEGGAESQFEINKKRDTELLKLRKLLEDVHLESEETAAILKRNTRKSLWTSRNRSTHSPKPNQAEKEKSKFQSEVYELISQVESVNKERLITVKHAEKLEITISELNVRIEELNRTICRTSSRSSPASWRMRAAAPKTTKGGAPSLEANLHQVETELESVRVQLEEESEARLDLERQLVKSQGEVQVWRSKYETEAAARAEEVEELRRKFNARIQEQEEHIEALLVKVNNLEKQKSRLQSEVEKANNTARELQKRVEQLERINIDLKTRLDETIQLYEQSQRDLRTKVSELQRTVHELDKTRELKDQLARENKKLADDLSDARITITELTRRLHEMELELRRLENEREELTAAYKEAEAGRKAEEQRAQRLSAELAQFRHEAEKRLQEKDEEIEAIRKATSIEIEQLNARVVEAETRLKTEVTRIKKKLQIQITELEMSLDSANKVNIDLQKTIKKQSFQLTEIQAHYDEVQRQLQVTLDQFSVSQRRVQALTAEVEEIRGNYESALRGKRQAEQLYEEAGTRINELTTINVNIASAKSKIEQELSAVVADYDEITKELRISDERYQRVQSELKHTVEILHEEQERVVKIEAIKKSLEIEVKNLSVRLEEVEANAIVGGKRIISKLEARLRDMEAELDEEKRRHAETIKILRKKERTVKEVMIQCEEDQKNIALLQESLDKANQKIVLFKRQLQEVEGVSSQSVTRVRRFQRELEAAEDRAETAESNLSLIRAKHRTFVTTSSVPGSQVYLVQESRTAEI